MVFKSTGSPESGVRWERKKFEFYKVPRYETAQERNLKLEIAEKYIA